MQARRPRTSILTISLPPQQKRRLPCDYDVPHLSKEIIGKEDDSPHEVSTRRLEILSETRSGPCVALSPEFQLLRKARVHPVVQANLASHDDDDDDETLSAALVKARERTATTKRGRDVEVTQDPGPVAVTNGRPIYTASKRDRHHNLPTMSYDSTGRDPLGYYSSSSYSDSDGDYSQCAAFPPHFFVSGPAPLQMDDAPISSPPAMSMAPVPMDDTVDLFNLDMDPPQAPLQSAQARAEIARSLIDNTIPRDHSLVQVYPEFVHEMHYNDGKLYVKVESSRFDVGNNLGFSLYKRESAQMIARCLTDQELASIASRRRKPLLKPYPPGEKRDFVLENWKSHRFWAAQALLYGICALNSIDDIKGRFVSHFKRSVEEKSQYSLDVDSSVADVEEILQEHLKCYLQYYSAFTGAECPRKTTVLRWDGIPIDQISAEETPLGERPRPSFAPKGKAMNRRRVIGKDPNASLYVGADHPDAMRHSY